MAAQTRRVAGEKRQIELEAIQRRAPLRRTNEDCITAQPKPPNTVDRILKRLRGNDGGDHASKFMALSPPPIDVIAEAKRIMKRARADDEQHSVDKAKWRQVEVEAEAMSSDGDDNAHDFSMIVIVAS